MNKAIMTGSVPTMGAIGVYSLPEQSDLWALTFLLTPPAGVGVKREYIMSGFGRTS